MPQANHLVRTTYFSHQNPYSLLAFCQLLPVLHTFGRQLYLVIFPHTLSESAQLEVPFENVQPADASVVAAQPRRRLLPVSPNLHP